MPPNPPALASPLAPAKVEGPVFHNRSIPSHPRNSARNPSGISFSKTGARVTRKCGHTAPLGRSYAPRASTAGEPCDMPSTPAALDWPLTSAAQGFVVLGLGFGVWGLRIGVGGGGGVKVRH
jgi:hypothetical protein